MRLLEAIHNVGPFFAFSPRIARAAGGPEEGLFLQFVLWKLCDIDDEVSLTSAEIEEGTGLTARRQESARRNLRALGVLRERLRGLPATLHYSIDAAWFDDVWRSQREGASRALQSTISARPDCNPTTARNAQYSANEPSSDKTSKLVSTKPRNPVRQNVETCFDETSKHSSSSEEQHKEHKNTLDSATIARRARRNARQDRQGRLSIAVDVEDLLNGKHDSNTGDEVLEATVRLWASVWSDAPSRVVVTSSRRRTWRETLKGGATPSDFAKAILGMKWDSSPGIDRADYCDFVHVARNLDRWLRLFAERGDPRMTKSRMKRRDLIAKRAANGKTYLVPTTYKWDASDENAAAMGFDWDEDAAQWRAPS